MQKANHTLPRFDRWMVDPPFKLAQQHLDLRRWYRFGNRGRVEGFRAERGAFFPHPFPFLQLRGRLIWRVG